MYQVPLWRHFESNDGAAGGASAGHTAGATAPGTGAPATPPPASPPVEPPAPSAAPSPDSRLGDARFAALAQYPKANVELLKGAVTPEQVNAIAAATHTTALELEQARAAGAQQPQAGVPVPSDNAATAAEGAEQRRIRELQFKVRQRVRPGARGGRTTLEPYEAEEAKDVFFRLSWNGHMGHRRDGRGNVSAPPQGAPAAPAVATLPAPGRAF